MIKMNKNKEIYYKKEYQHIIIVDIIIILIMDCETEI